MSGSCSGWFVTTAGNRCQLSSGHCDAFGKRTMMYVVVLGEISANAALRGSRKNAHVCPPAAAQSAKPAGNQRTNDSVCMIASGNFDVRCIVHGEGDLMPACTKQDSGSVVVPFAKGNQSAAIVAYSKLAYRSDWHAGRPRERPGTGQCSGPYLRDSSKRESGCRCQSPPVCDGGLPNHETSCTALLDQSLQEVLAAPTAPPQSAALKLLRQQSFRDIDGGLPSSLR